jgi:hypothetical protein
MDWEAVESNPDPSYWDFGEPEDFCTDIWVND